MKHLTTILIVILAALSSLSARATGVIVNGTNYDSSAASVNAAIAKLVAEGTKVFLYTDGTSSVDGTINITGGEIVIRTDKGRSTTSTVANFIASDNSKPLFHISGGNVTFDNPAGGATKGSFRGSIGISGGNVTFASQNNYYEYPVNIAGGTVTIDAGTFGAYYHSSNCLTPNASMGGPALNVLDRGVVTLNGGRFITTATTASTASCVYSQREAGVVFKTGYALYTTDTNERLTFSNHNFVTPGGTLATDATLKAISYEAVITRGDVSTNYETLAEAWSEAQNSSESVLLIINRDLSISEPLVFTKGDVSLTTYNNTLSAAESFGTSPLITVSGGHLTVGPQGTGTTIITNDYGPAIEATGKACVDFGRANVTSAGVPLTFSNDAKVTVQSGTYTCTGADTPIFNITSPNVIIIGGQYVSTAHHVGDFPTASLFAGYTAQSNVDEEVVELTRGEGTLRLPTGEAPTNVRIRSASKPFKVTTTGGTTTAYGDLALAYALLDPATISSVTLTDNGGITRPISVVSDLTLNLGSNTVTFDPSFEGIGFDVKRGASLAVTANDDGGVRSMGEKTGVLFETREGSKRLAFRGGCYESYGLVVDANNVGDFEIRDGYFHSVNGPAVLIGFNGQNVSGGRFVTDRVDEDGMPYYAVIASSRTSVAPGYAFFAPSLDGEGEVELVAHGGSLEYWGTNSNASDVTVKPVGPYASVSIGGTSTDYNDIFAAFTAAQEAESATVTLKRDVLISGQCIELTKGNITLNMGEYTMASERHGYIFQACGSVQFTINRTGMTDRGYPNQVYNFIQQTNGTLTINGGYFDGTNCALQVVNGSKAVINGGTFVGDNNAVFVYGAQCVINDGRFTARTPGNAAIYAGTDGVVTSGALSMLVDAATRKPIVLAADEKDVREGSLYSLDAEGHPVADVITAPATPAFDVTIGGVVSKYADLSTAFIINDPTTVTAARALTDATIGRTINVTSDFTLDLGSHTATLADGADVLFIVQNDASLTVNANADGGLKALHSKAQVLIHSNDEGANCIAIHGGRYECTGVVVNAWSAKELEITDGYFHSLSSTAAYFSVDSKKVTGGRFVTPNYAIITSRGSISAEYGYFDGDGRELCEHSGPLQDWGTSEYAHDVTIRRVGPRASVTIGGTTTGYGSIFDAFKAAQQAESATVTLKRDILISEKTLELTQGNITLNMGEYYITAERTGHALKVDGTASLTINRTGLTDRGYPHQGGAEYLYNTSTGTLTVNGGYFGGGFYSGAGTNLVINGGVFEGYDYALWTYKAKSTLRGGRFISHDGKNSAISLEGEEHGCDLDGSHFYASATNEELTIQAAPDKWGYPSHAPCDAKGNRVSDFYIAPAPATVTTLTHVIDDARHGKATLDDIRRAVDAVLLK